MIEFYILNISKRYILLIYPFLTVFQLLFRFRFIRFHLFENKQNKDFAIGQPKTDIIRAVIAPLVSLLNQQWYSFAECVPINIIRRFRIFLHAMFLHCTLVQTPMIP